MEAVGLASGVAGLITLALQVTGAINEYATAVQDRSKNVKELRDELSLLADVLRQLKDFLTTEHATDNNFDEGCVLENAVKDCTARIERIGSMIRPISGGRLSRTWEKMTWPFEQKDILQMVENLRRFTHTFQFALSIRGYAILSKTSDDASKMLEVMLGEVKKIGEMSKLIPGLEDAAQNSRKTSMQIQEIMNLMPTLLSQAGKISEVSQAVRMAEERERERRKAEILDWLAPASNSHKHIDAQKKRTLDTGKWFLEHEYFLHWAEHAEVRNDLLCIGGPGRGKTFLCSMVIDHLRQLYTNKNTAVVHYYCDFSEQQTQTPLHLVCYILRQLCQSAQTIPPVVNEFYNKTRHELRDSFWFLELQSVVQTVIASYHQCIIVLDAIDETEAKQRTGIFDTLATIRASHGITRVFATTRPHIDIEKEFLNVVKIEISADVSDLRQFLVKRIDEHAHSKELVDDKLRDEIIEKLCQHADGMFLLPALQIEQVLDQVTKGDVRRALNSLETNLEDTFKSTLTRIRDFSSRKQELAYKILMWVSHARRPLTMVELRHALAVRFDEEDISEDDLPPLQTMLDSCCGLVEMDLEIGYVRFVHFSLYEYLRKESHGLFSEGDTILVRTCLKYLTFDSLKSLPFKNRNDFLAALDELPLLEYASLYWGFHARNLDVQVYQDLALPLLNDSHSLLVTARVRDMRSPDYRKWKERMWSWAFNGGGGISLAASFGLADLTRLLIGQTKDPVLSARNMYGSTPLHECAIHGWLQTAKVLISYGADLTDSNRGKATPFYLAVSYGQLEMCQMLLEYDRRQLDIPCRDGYTALHKACDLGSDEIASLLLHASALVNAREQDGMTPLHLACRRGHLAVIKVLTSARADISPRSADGVTPLDLASTGGFLEIVQFLIQHGADVNNKSRFRWTALHRASKAGHAGIAKLLLDNGADLQCEDSGGRTPLTLAVKGGDMVTVKLLLEYDPATTLQQLQHKEKGGSSTRSVAFYTAHYAIHKYLRDLENELLGHDPIFHPGPDPMLPLTHAIETGLLSMVQALLEAEPALLTMKDASGCTALHIAFIEGQREIAEEILNRGVSINIKGYHDWAPIHIAASHGSVSMLALALSYNADIHALTETLQTPLHKAASAHNLTNIIELLRCGSDPSSRNSKGMNAVHVAAYQNFEGAVREMLKPEWFNNITATQMIGLASAKDFHDRTPRIWAEFAGHIELATYLRIEERRNRAGLSGRADSLASIPLSRINSALSTDSSSKTLSVTDRQPTVEPIERSVSPSAAAAISAQPVYTPTIPGTPTLGTSQIFTPGTPSSSTTTATAAAAAAAAAAPTTRPRRGEHEGLVEMERRYAEMALEFDSD